MTGLAWPARADEAPVFERQVRPILKTYCLDCHGASEKPKAGLDLRLKRLAERGGENGPALVPGKPDESLLVERLKAGEMPPGEKKVPPEQIAVIERWIAAGAPTGRAEPESLPPGIDITPEERAFWAFQPIGRPDPPKLAPADGGRNPIDAFVLAKLKAKGFGFAPEADRLTLIRRAAFDLTGLPPSQADVEAYLSDQGDQAYERMIDRLLASTHYGERWARHWLDVAGYADSEGNGNDDTLRPYAYKYRDYVIRSLNADKPLDRFIIEQLAGDELAARPWKNMTAEQVELLAATGFLRTAVDGTATGAPDEALASNQVVADTLKIVSSTFLGLTVGCAQCHDHKYDPIPQSDYYRLRAVFEPALDPNHWRRPVQRLVSLATDADRAKWAAIEAEVAVLQKAVDEKTAKFMKAALEKVLAKFPEAERPTLREAANTPPPKRTDAQKKLLAANPSVDLSPGVLYQYEPAAAEELKKDNEKIAAKRAEKPVEDFVSLLDEPAGTPPQTRIFYRGDHRQPTQPVQPGDLTIAAPEGKRYEIASKDPAAATSGRRLAYAKRLVDGTHPLVGRVLVNRIWMHHFGRGLVDTPGDFGALGSRPTHPELLDWLAGELVRRGWSLKAMHRLMMTSAAYRQSSRRDPAKDAVDGDNTLYGRHAVTRLDAEALRDRMLHASGRLDRTAFGPSIVVAEDSVGQIIASGSSRRSLYLQVRRTKPESFLAAFDAPAMAVNCDRRISSTSAPQSLMLMNSEFVLDLARAFAQRIRAEAPADATRPALDALAVKHPRPGGWWSFGFGAFDESTQRTAGFTPMPHWTGSSWQGGPALPDPSVGWAILHARGGHAGSDQQHATIRRWTAPRDGVFAVSGKLSHAGQGGDGVRARVVSSRDGLLGHWQAARGASDTPVARAELKAGDTLDFIVDCLGDVNCDSFDWPARIALADSGLAWDSAAEFHGPLALTLPKILAHAWQVAYQRPVTDEELGWACEFVSKQWEAPPAAGADADRELSALTNFCQQLLTSNEFLYVD